MAPPPTTPFEADPQAVLNHLRRIEESEAFNDVEEQRWVLRFVVEETLAGRGAKGVLNSAKIAKEVFGEGDGQVARTHFGRLRRTLLAYYRYEPPPDGFEIKLPKKGYTPTFCHATLGTDARKKVGQASAPFQKFESGKPIFECELDAEIRNFFARRRISVGGIDEYIELGHSADWVGWTRKEIEIQSLGDYALPPELEQMEAAFPLPPYRKREAWNYSLCDYQPIVADKGEPLILETKVGRYGLEYSLLTGGSQIGGTRRPYRSLCENLFQVRKSPLFHAIVCHVVVLTEELDGSQNLLLCRRSRDVDFFSGHWSATMEEHMMFKHFDPNVTISDLHPFDAVRRGLEAELQLHISDDDIRMLTFGIEWNVWNAALCFVVKVRQSYNVIAEGWARADDRDEASILDFVQAVPDGLKRLLKTNTWSASDNAWFRDEPTRSEEDKRKHLGDNRSDKLHPTSRARIHALVRHLEAIERSLI